MSDKRNSQDFNLSLLHQGVLTLYYSLRLPLLYHTISYLSTLSTPYL
nr:MAG TPA: hypothetical protein [Caudoviricetes sp.]